MKEMLGLNRRMRRELLRKLRKALGLRNTLGDRIIIEDEVLVYEGKKLLFKSRGHIVNQGLIAIINIMSAAALAGATSVPSGAGILSWSVSPFTYGRMLVGTGVGVTTGTMADLVTPVLTSPNSQSGATASPALGTYRVSWIATWNAGTLAAIDVSELGLYLYLVSTLAAFGATLGAATARAFFSRLSDSDGDFTTFTVNIAVPLTIEWRLTFTFA